MAQPCSLHWRSRYDDAASSAKGRKTFRSPISPASRNTCVRSRSSKLSLAIVSCLTYSAPLEAGAQQCRDHYAIVALVTPESQGGWELQVAPPKILLPLQRGF